MLGDLPLAGGLDQRLDGVVGKKGHAGHFLADRVRHLVERQHGVGQAGLGDRAVHPVDGAGGLVLDEHAATGLAHLARAVERVAAQARQHAEHDALAERLDGVGDRHVRARAQRADRRRVGERDGAVAADAQVAAGGGDQQRAAVEAVAGGGLADVERGVAVEALGEGLRVPGRHVLHEQATGAERARQRGHERGERAGASRRAGDDDDAAGGVRAHVRGDRPKGPGFEA